MTRYELNEILHEDKGRFMVGITVADPLVSKIAILAYKEASDNGNTKY